MTTNIYSNRGLKKYPENSLDAIENSFKIGFGVKVDVRSSLDGIPMCIHDKSLWRTHGLKKNVNSLCVGDLKSYGIPTLETVLLLAKEYDKPLLVNIKTQSTRIYPWVITQCTALGVPMHIIDIITWTPTIKQQSWEIKLYHGDSRSLYLKKDIHAYTKYTTKEDTIKRTSKFLSTILSCNNELALRSAMESFGDKYKYVVKV